MNYKSGWLTVNRACNLRCKWCYAQKTGFKTNDDLDDDRDMKPMTEIIKGWGKKGTANESGEKDAETNVWYRLFHSYDDYDYRHYEQLGGMFDQSSHVIYKGQEEKYFKFFQESYISSSEERQYDYSNTEVLAYYADTSGSSNDFVLLLVLPYKVITTILQIPNA